jgi:hypothetical protein
MAVGTAEFEIKFKPTRKDIEDSLIFLNNLVVYHLLRINYTSFLQKAGVPAYRSMGGVDVYDGKWRPLAPSTIERKRTAKQLYANKVVINIRTRQLSLALKPGWMRNNRYVPRPNQIVTITKNSINIKIDVPYADAVHAVRHIFVKNRQNLINHAVEAALPQFEAYLKYLESNKQKGSK